MKLVQIPFSHNCIKVRRALELKGLSCEIQDIAPMDRAPVMAASGQRLVPVLVDGDRAIADSTAILRYLEERGVGTPLLPAAPEARAECWLLEDWADSAFMAVSRRLAYGQVCATPGALEQLFAPDATGLRRTLIGILGRRAVKKRFGISDARNARDEPETLRRAALAVERLGGRPFLVGDSISVADIALASMSAPLWVASPAVRSDPAVSTLLAWGEGILGDSIAGYKRKV